MRKIKALVCCECSQNLTSALLLYGFDAYSCDIQPCFGPFPERHFIGDALSFLYSDSWDLVVAHPPCTYLSKLNGPLIKRDPGRILKGFEAASFFYEFYNYPGRILIENPTPLKIFNLPQASQVIDYANFGSPFHKRTLFWLKDLPPIIPIYSDSLGVSDFQSYKFGSNRQYKRSLLPSGLCERIASTFFDFFLTL